MRKKLVKGVLLVVPVLILPGCYTAINAPRASGRPVQQDAWESSGQRLKAQERSAEEEFYRYPGDIYGYGGEPYPYRIGTPYIGYSSATGMYGYGSYGYSGYGNGYGPYGYGADPYYVDNGGYHLPPGYELITTRELEDYRHTIRTLTTRQTDPEKDARAEEQRRQMEEDREHAFRTRLTPTRTRAVDVEPYVAPASAPSGSVSKSSGGSGSTTTSSKSSASGSREGKDIKSKSKRRRVW